MRTEAAQLRLLTWFSPAFPVGAFGWSHGLETAIAEGAVATAQDLRAWIEGLVRYGSGWSDAVLFRVAWEARSGDELQDVAELARALAPSLERQRETLAQGAAFLKAVTQMLPSRGSCREATEEVEGQGAVGCTPLRPFGPPPPRGEGDREAVEGALPRHLPYPVAAGRACAEAGLPLSASLTAWLHGFAANLVSVALRAVPLGQSDGVAVIAALEPVLLATAERALDAGLDDLGGCAFLSDIAAMRHETLQPRLFLS